MSQRPRRRAAGTQSQRNHTEDGSSQASNQNSQREMFERTLESSQCQIPSDIPRNVFDKFVSDCVYYLLIADQKKIPIKKPDLVKSVMKECPKTFPLVIAEAEKILELTYGINLVKLPENKGFILINRQTINHTKEVPIWSPLDASKQSLLTIILSIIFMKGDCITENALWTCLNKFGISQTKPHDVHGDCKKLIADEFVKQLYLDCVTMELTDERSVGYRWGIRANLEVKKSDILKFVCKVYGNGMKPQHWQAQWALVQKEEGVVEEETQDDNESDSD